MRTIITIQKIFANVKNYSRKLVENRESVKSVHLCQPTIHK